MSGQVWLPATLWDFTLVNDHEGCWARAGSDPDQDGVQALVYDGVTPDAQPAAQRRELVGPVSAFTSGICVIPFTFPDLPTTGGRWQITAGTDIKFAPTNGQLLILQPTGSV